MRSSGWALMLWGVLIRWRSGHRYTHRDDPGRTRAADGHLHAQERGLGDPACLAVSPRDCETAASAGSAAGAVTGPRGPQGGQGTSHPSSPRPRHNTLPPQHQSWPGTHRPLCPLRWSVSPRAVCSLQLSTPSESSCQDQHRHHPQPDRCC